MKVQAGFYRKLLLPKGKPTLLTPEVLKEMQLQQERIEAEKKRPPFFALRVNFILAVLIKRKYSAFMSSKFEVLSMICSSDSMNAIGGDVDRKLVTVPEIREIGEYVAEIQLHSYCLYFHSVYDLFQCSYVGLLIMPNTPLSVGQTASGAIC
ncbi:unnamed protein product [Miscanthus lutarioriparius]|uniref:Uncharacterized protein n=1 Tax=Miscanthus lutarioriparius TaxID=422564 RepID=A0A811R3G7_9POAL|nr:unnamed protein product [Miscanthus lutarioriparius]